MLPAILAEPRSSLTGLVTRNPAKAEPYGVPCWTSLDVALAEQECDAVYVASPVFLHAPQTIASLRAGRNVLCEKPMAMNYDEALSMQSAAEETGQVLGIAYYRRMYPQYSPSEVFFAATTASRSWRAAIVEAELSCLGQTVRRPDRSSISHSASTCRADGFRPS